MNFVKLLLLFVILNSSCSVIENKKQFSKIVSQTFSANDLKKTDYIIVIPNHGCTGCITSSEIFYDEYRDLDNIKFVFTNIISSKILKQKIEINKNNTYMDYDNYFLKSYPPKKQIYPCIIELKNGAISNIYYQSMEENGLSTVTHNINKK